MKAHIVKISPAELEPAFPLIGQFIMRGIEASDGRIDIESFCRLVADGDWVLWGVYVTDEDGTPTFKAVVASELHETPSGQLEAGVPFTGGFEHREWAAEVLSFLEGWAEAAGAVRMEIKGRTGWKRFLSDYKTRHVILHKKLGKSDGKPIRARRENGHAREHVQAV